MRPLSESAIGGSETLERRHGTSPIGRQWITMSRPHHQHNARAELEVFDAQPMAHASELGSGGTSAHDEAAARFSLNHARG
jgi:hypothetical protein